MSKYLVYIEVQGDLINQKRPVAHVPTLPGAAARGKTVEEVKENIRTAIVEYLQLLRNVGEPVPRAGEGLHLEFEEVETTTFLTDYDALRPNELEMLLRWMAISRQELMDLVKSLPETAFEWTPEGETRTLREVLNHIAEADLRYTDRLHQWPEAPLYRLAATRGVALERLRALTEAERANMTIHAGEEWTPRKVIRRMLEHEREHIVLLKRWVEDYRRASEQNESTKR
jgi:predicted RNase H-like HicB family nuclease/uncharacterized damage-inducible protein DinB